MSDTEYQQNEGTARRYIYLFFSKHKQHMYNAITLSNLVHNYTCIYISFWCVWKFNEMVKPCAGFILGLRPANEKRRYDVTPSLVGWAQAL